MSAVSGALSRATTLVTLVALLVGTLVAVLTSPSGAETAAAPTAPERRYAPGIDPSLDADATLGGLVLGPRGHLRDNVLVEALAVLDPTGDPVASDLTYEVGDTASHGAYELHLPAGDYLLRFSSPDGATVPLEPTYYGGGAGETVTVAGAQDRRLETVVMQDDQGVPVTGRVLGVDGAPAAEAGVYLVRPAEHGYSVRRRGTTADDGTFTFNGVRRARPFTVAFVTGDDVPVTWLGGAPSHLTADTFTVPAGAADHALGDLRALAGVPVTGRVTSPSGPVEADVALLHLDGTGGAEVVAWDWLEGDDEAYAFPALPGTYTIGVLAYGAYGAGDDWVYLGDTTDLDQATTFTVVPSTPYAVGDLVLSRRNIEVTVDVLDPGGVLDPADSEVMLLSPDGDWLDAAYPTGVGDRYAAHVRFGTVFTVAVLDWTTGDWWLLGGATSELDDATFLTAPASGTTFHAGTITVVGDVLVAPVPALMGQARSGQVIAVGTPAWSVPDAVSTYQWLRDGWPIQGATASAYLLRPDDVGHEVSVRVTGTASGRRGSVTSESRLVGSGSAPTALVLPTVTGPVRLGGVLTASPGVWDVAGTVATYQWLSDDRPVGNGDRLTLGWDQVGTTVTVTVTATAPGWPPATFTSAPLEVPREKPQVVAERHGKRVLVRVVSASPDLTGKVTFFGGRAVGKERLTAQDRGRAWFGLDLFKGRTGQRRVFARFGGNDRLAAVKSPAITVRIR